MVPMSADCMSIASAHLYFILSVQQAIYLHSGRLLAPPTRRQPCWFPTHGSVHHRPAYNVRFEHVEGGPKKAGVWSCQPLGRLYCRPSAFRSWLLQVG